MSDIAAMAADFAAAMARFETGMLASVRRSAEEMAAAATKVNSPYYGVAARAKVVATDTGAVVTVQVASSGGPGSVPGGVHQALAVSQDALDSAAREAGLDRHR